MCSRYPSSRPTSSASSNESAPAAMTAPPRRILRCASALRSLALVFAFDLCSASISRAFNFARRSVAAVICSCIERVAIVEVSQCPTPHANRNSAIGKSSTCHIAITCHPEIEGHGRARASQPQRETRAKRAPVSCPKPSRIVTARIKARAHLWFPCGKPCAGAPPQTPARFAGRPRC